PASSLAVPTSACVLATGKATSAPFGWYDTDGFPTISGDGLMITFSCYVSALGARIQDRASVGKTLAIVDALARVDTSTHTGGAPYGGVSGANTLVALHSVVTQDGSVLYYSSTPGYQSHLAYQGGYGRVTRGATGTTWISP